MKIQRPLDLSEDSTPIDVGHQDEAGVDGTGRAKVSRTFGGPLLDHLIRPQQD